MSDPITPILKAVTADEAEKLEDQATNPDDVRQKVASILSRTQRCHRILGAPSALPAMRRTAKDELVMLSKEALALWALV